MTTTEDTTTKLLQPRRRRRRRPSSRIAGLSACLAVTVTLSTLFYCATAEDYDNTTDQSYDEATSRSDSGGDNDDEVDDNIDAMVIASFSFLCAICMSFFSINLLYFAFLEDKLLKRYKEEGVMLHACVYSTDKVRRGMPVSNINNENHLASMPSHEFSSKSTELIKDGLEIKTDQAQQHGIDTDAEYIAVVEYRWRNPGTATNDSGDGSGYNSNTSHIPCAMSPSRCVVRKQVKARGSDFAKADIPKTIEIIKVDEDLSEAPSCCVGKSTRQRQEPLELTVLVLPEHVNSGMALAQVDRSRTISYRIPTLVMFAALMIVTSFFLVLGVLGFKDGMPYATTNADGGDDEAAAVSIGGVAKWTGSLLASLLVVEAAITHFFLRAPINDALEEEYLKGGDFVLSSGDSTSISSGDDSYLLLPNEMTNGAGASAAAAAVHPSSIVVV